MTKNSWLYIVFISLALFFHVLNKLQINESLKVFHLFAAAAMCLGFIMRRYKNQFDNILNYFLLWTAFSSALSPVESFGFSFFKFLIIVLSLTAIQIVNIDWLIISINCIIPVALSLLLRQYYLEPVFRYEGFYEDPNYFCTTLLVFYFFILLLWKRYDIKWLRSILIFEIVTLWLLTSLSLSRTGLLCIALLTIAYFGDIFMKNKILTGIGTSVILFAVYRFFGNYIDMTIAGLLERQTANVGDSIENARNLRIEISMRGISYLLSHPLSLLQGIGFGTFSNAGILNGWHASSDHIDHNTLTSCFSEQGLIGFVLLIRLFYLLYVKIKNNRILKLKGLKFDCLCTLIIFLIFSLSINQMTYFPFWLTIFTLSNLSNESTINA